MPRSAQAKLKRTLQDIEGEAAALREAMTKRKWPAVMVGLVAFSAASLRQEPSL